MQSKEDNGLRLHWLIGTYWERTRDDTSDYYAIPALKPNGDAFQYYASYYGGTKPPRPGEWYGYTERYDYLQMTEFLNLTFDLTKRLKLEVGAVHFESHFNAIVHGGYFCYDPNNEVSQGPGGSEKWNFKGGLSYKATDDLLLYIDAAQGFRDGGVNPGLPPQCTKNGVPRDVQAGHVDQLRSGLEIDPVRQASTVERGFLLDALEKLPVAALRSERLRNFQLRREHRQRQDLRHRDRDQVRAEFASQHGCILELQRLANHYRYLL